MANTVKATTLAEVTVGSFVGIVAVGFIGRSVKIGETVRARVTVVSLISLGLGLVLGLIMSRLNKPVGVGLAAGFGGMGLVGLTSLFLLPSATLDAPVATVNLPGTESEGLAGLLTVGSGGKVHAR